MKTTTIDRSIGWGALLLVVSLVLTACAGGPTTAPTAEPEAVDAATSVASSGGPAGSADAESAASAASGLCNFLPSDKAAAALGEPVGEGVADKSTLTGTYSCRYTATGSDNVIEIEYQKDQTRSGWEAAMDKVGMTEETKLEGVGEIAYRSGDAVLSPGTRLAAFDQGNAIWVVIYKDADPAIFPAAETVALDLLAQLDA
jgi:hypothetical protein